MSKALTYDSSHKTITVLGLEASISYIFFEGGSVLTTGVKGDLRIPFDCEIQRYTLLANEVGSIQIDVWKDTYSSFPSSVADSITGSDTPYIDNYDCQRTYLDSLSDWSTIISEDDILSFHIDSVTDITRCTLSLKVIRT